MNNRCGTGKCTCAHAPIFADIWCLPVRFPTVGSPSVRRIRSAPGEQPDGFTRLGAQRGCLFKGAFKSLQPNVVLQASCRARVIDDLGNTR